MTNVIPIPNCLLWHCHTIIILLFTFFLYLSFLCSVSISFHWSDIFFRFSILCIERSRWWNINVKMHEHQRNSNKTFAKICASLRKLRTKEDANKTTTNSQKRTQICSQTAIKIGIFNKLTSHAMCIFEINDCFLVKTILDEWHLCRTERSLFQLFFFLVRLFIRSFVHFY